MNEILFSANDMATALLISAVIFLFIGLALGTWTAGGLEAYLAYKIKRIKINMKREAEEYMRGDEDDRNM